MSRILKHAFSGLAVAAAIAAGLPADAETSREKVQPVRAIDRLSQGEGRQFSVELDGYVPPASWLPQILGGKAVINAEVAPDAYEIKTRVRAAGILDWFVNYSSTLHSTGKIDSREGVTPQLYTAQDDEGRKNRRTRIVRTDRDIEVEVVPPHGNLGDPAPTLAQKMEAMDPMSALLSLAVNPNATPEDPCRNVVRIFDGKGRYNLHTSLAKHIDKLDAPGWKGPAFICNVRYEEVAGYKKKSPEEIAAQQKDLKWVNIILADLGPGEVRVPVKIEARSEKRGKITLVARQLTYSPLKTDHADNDDAEGPSRG